MRPASAPKRRGKGAGILRSGAVHQGKRKLFYGADLAELHSRHYSDFIVSAAPHIIRILRDRAVKGGLVCDVGCGGGQLSALLAKAGYESFGLDISPAMVALARKNAPGSTFICGSIAEAKLPRCAAAVAAGEVFNYLGSRTRITRAFRNIFFSLRPLGILLFDTKEPPRQKVSRISCRTGPDWAVLAHIQEDPVRKKLVRQIEIFRKVGPYYRRRTEIHALGIYRASDIRTMLRSIGFHVRIFAGYGTYKLTPDRKVILATKPQTD